MVLEKLIILRIDMEIDIERLKKDLIDYFGTCALFNPAAFINVREVETASDEELINIAIQNNFDLSYYEICKRR